MTYFNLDHQKVLEDTNLKIKILNDIFEKMAETSDRVKELLTMKNMTEARIYRSFSNELEKHCQNECRMKNIPIPPKPKKRERKQADKNEAITQRMTQAQMLSKKTFDSVTSVKNISNPNLHPIVSSNLDLAK